MPSSWNVPHKPIHLEEIATHEIKPLDYLKELRVAAISGIARPESFEGGLRKLGAEVIYSRRYDRPSPASARARSRRCSSAVKARGARAVITTEKDTVRFPRLGKRPLPVYFLRVEIEIIRGHDAFARIADRMCHYEEPAKPPAVAGFGLELVFRLETVL